jgi:mono/diheme cytochrome c family protein
VLDRLRRQVMSFRDMELEQTRDTVYMEAGEVDVSMLNAIQQAYFNTTCANCHGASNRAAAGLYLTQGRSYAALVGQPSTKVPGINMVEPGSAASSLLHRILHEEQVEGISMTHRDLVSEQNEQNILPLIDSWINNGAKEN